VLTGRETSEATLARTRELLDGLGCTAMVEPDPDLPMLLKNMHASVL
jgi:hypothetical protein